MLDTTFAKSLACPQYDLNKTIINLDNHQVLEVTVWIHVDIRKHTDTYFFFFWTHMGLTQIRQMHLSIK